MMSQDEVLLEFHVDDTADDKEDTLVEMAFHVPAGNEQWGTDAQQQGAEGEDAVVAVPAAKVGDMLLALSVRAEYSLASPAGEVSIGCRACKEG
jgi:hypothetical protein